MYTSAQWDAIGEWAAILISLAIILIASRIRMPKARDGKETVKPTYRRLK